MVGVRIAFRLEPVSLRPIVCKGRGLQKTDEELNKTGQTSELMTISSVPAISSMQSHFGEHWHLRPPVRSRGERGNPECGHRRCYELNLVEQPKPVPEVSFWLARWQSVPTNSRLWEAGSHEFRQPGVELSFGLLRTLESHLSAGRPARPPSIWMEAWPKAQQYCSPSLEPAKERENGPTGTGTMASHSGCFDMCRKLSCIL